MGVGLPAVGGPVDAVAPGRALPVVGLARADPHQVGVRLRDGDVANRHQALVLELGLERRAVVDGLPDAPVGGAYVVDRRVRLVDREIGDPPGHRGRPDLPEVQRIEGPAGRRRRRRLARDAHERLAGEREEDRHAESDETIVSHEDRPPVSRGALPHTPARSLAPFDQLRAPRARRGAGAPPSLFELRRGSPSLGLRLQPSGGGPRGPRRARLVQVVIIDAAVRQRQRDDGHWPCTRAMAARSDASDSSEPVNNPTG